MFTYIIVEQKKAYESEWDISIDESKSISLLSTELFVGKTVKGIAFCES